MACGTARSSACSLNRDGDLGVHPSTIASASTTKEGLVLMCKRTGRWTTKMYELGNTPTCGNQGKELERCVKAMVEGRYGMIRQVAHVPRSDLTVYRWCGQHCHLRLLRRSVCYRWKRCDLRALRSPGPRLVRSIR